MKPSTRSVLKLGKWLIFPIYQPFLRGARAFTLSRQVLRDRRAFIEASAIDTALAPVMNPATIRALVSTRRNGRLCLLLFIGTLGVWIWSCVHQATRLYSLASVQFGVILLVLLAEFIRLSFSNWLLRTGGTGRFQAFIARGGNLWPR
ncbi:hypothetical protein HK27_11865 [Acetobacter orientalis]|uniref:hypothetical protein n=1 Tax=Acetobacter TaxID=434 RepID=UPI000A38FFCC|nr:hypothetical protein [Acetobacter orientalis]OUJ15054.1 hypothetical protein HK27_11865 [Acetobacter orientalis]